MISQDFRVEPASWDADFNDLRSVREQVFVVEQEVPREDEIDALDSMGVRSIPFLAGTRVLASPRTSRHPPPLLRPRPAAQPAGKFSQGCGETAATAARDRNNTHCCKT